MGWPAALYRSCAFAAAAVLHLHAVAASAPARVTPPLLPRRIVDNLAYAPLRVECRVRRGPLRNAVLRGVLVLQEDGGCEVVLEDGASVNGTWTMLPAGHEILDRLWDEVRFDAVLADGVPYVAHARLYARWSHSHALTSHGAVLRGTHGWLRPVVASFTLSHVT
ncbi:unnamed protein product [Pelagomonas calceolata]|uniref:Uncharacterized protein n=2 Tax=Pelagomonas calceolata TaxID=35677 RepID=A0A8J2WW91_9STRA|nr:unnamed protein product [Pelagomonas calceolata]